MNFIINIRTKYLFQNILKFRQKSYFRIEYLFQKIFLNSDRNLISENEIISKTDFIQRSDISKHISFRRHSLCVWSCYHTHLDTELIIQLAVHRWTADHLEKRAKLETNIYPIGTRHGNCGNTECMKCKLNVNANAGIHSTSKKSILIENLSL